MKGKRETGKLRAMKRGTRKRNVIWGRLKKKDREKTWFHSKNTVTAGVQVLLEKRGPRPLCDYYSVIKPNDSNSLGEVTASIVGGI